MIHRLSVTPEAPGGESELERRNRELVTLHLLAQDIADSLETREVLESALATLVRMGWFGCGEAHLRSDGLLRTVAVGLCPEDAIDSCPLRPQIDADLEAVCAAGELERRGNWQLLPVSEHALLALAGGDASESFLTAVADLVGASLKRTELHHRLAAKEAQRSRLLQALLSAQEEERGRISRDLHDQIGQALTAVLLGLDHELARRDDVTELQRLKKLASATLADVRRIALDLRPSLLDELGLEAAVKRYAREVHERFGLELNVLVRLPQRLEHEEEIVLYRVVQEAVTNVVRHAGATQASVVVTADERQVKLVVEDDGRGFDPGALLPLEQVGIVGMRERLEIHGGGIRIESRPGGGCAVHARLPRRPSYVLGRLDRNAAR